MGTERAASASPGICVSAKWAIRFRVALASCAFKVYTVDMASKISLALRPVSAAVPGALYQQIVDAVKREVGAGRLAPNSVLPSFRVLAEELLVSVITVKRAYEELEREGIIYRRQGLGTFVAEAGHDRMRAGLRASAEKAITEAIQAGREAGMSDPELLHTFKDALRSAPSGALSQRRIG
jgi:GntR family transcriptional regulator